MSPVPKKKDPSITFLNKFGYNVIKLPRTGIEPLDVIGRERRHLQQGKRRYRRSGNGIDEQRMRLVCGWCSRAGAHV